MTIADRLDTINAEREQIRASTLERIRTLPKGGPKLLADAISVTPQLVNHWLHGRLRLPDHHIRPIETALTEMETKR